jgi:NAD(P)H-nitrite reductase large subunit
VSEKKTYLCRCEDLSREELYELLDKDDLSMEEIKRLTRCTMGPCQGRTCRELIAKEIANYRGIDITEVDEPIFRAPIKPIKLGAITRGDENA